MANKVLIFTKLSDDGIPANQFVVLRLIDNLDGTFSLLIDTQSTSGYPSLAANIPATGDPIVAGGSAIGGVVAGGNPLSILFVDENGDLGQDVGLLFSPDDQEAFFPGDVSAAGVFQNDDNHIGAGFVDSNGSPAQSGLLRGRNDTPLVVARNAGNDTDVEILRLNASDAIVLGSGNDAAVIIDVLGGGRFTVDSSGFGGTLVVRFEGQDGPRLGAALNDQTRPEYSLTNDTNTGIYFPAAEVVGITTAGVERVRFDSTGVDIPGSHGYQVNNIQVVGEQQAAIADPVGWVVVDAEARTAVEAILDAMRTHGLIDT